MFKKHVKHCYSQLQELEYERKKKNLFMDQSPLGFEAESNHYLWVV